MVGSYEVVSSTVNAVHRHLVKGPSTTSSHMSRPPSPSSQGNHQNAGRATVFRGFLLLRRSRSNSR
ncbi:hypothetical protein GAY31_08750 [Azospirillum brasilense]|nr:hypothetical protein [Azospirillum brasilense]